LLDRRFADLEFTPVPSGLRMHRPVSYQLTGRTVVIVPDHPQQDTWWHVFGTPRPVRLWLDGEYVSGTGRLMTRVSTGDSVAPPVVLVALR
jgi:hypothetical protein